MLYHEAEGDDLKAARDALGVASAERGGDLFLIHRESTRPGLAIESRRECPPGFQRPCAQSQVASEYERVRLVASVWRQAPEAGWPGSVPEWPRVEEDPPVTTPSCERGEAVGCELVAAQQRGTAAGRRALEEARALREEGCEYGDLVDCRTLGWLLWRGQGYSRDPDAARALLARAHALQRVGCEIGDGEACADAAEELRQGSPGVERDPELAATLAARAVELETLSCDAGDPAACARLADAHWHGRGTPRDDEAAVAGFERACLKGLAAACARLGAAWLEGRGTPRADEPRARAHFIEACALGLEPVCEALVE